jgi:transcriptional regulator with XRE-family HTH domain
MQNRLEKILKEFKLSPSRLADQMGIQRSGISHIMSGRNKPSFDFLNSLLILFPELDANWLLTGKGDMLKSEEKEDKLVKDIQPVQTTGSELFTDEHFKGISANDQRVEKAESSSAQDLSEQAVYSSGSDSSRKEESDDVEKVILLLKSGKFRSFEKDTGKS